MSDILVHTEAGVCTISFNRLARKNSITSDMYAAMADAMQAATSDAAIRVVVIQGDETIFSAGNDIGDFLEKPPQWRRRASVSFSAQHLGLPQASHCRRERPGRGHRHHAAVPLRLGLCR